VPEERVTGEVKKHRTEKRGRCNGTQGREARVEARVQRDPCCLASLLCRPRTPRGTIHLASRRASNISYASMPHLKRAYDEEAQLEKEKERAPQETQKLMSLN